MNVKRCPHCGIKLGNFQYADACPHCHEELMTNTRPLTGAKPNSRKVALWPGEMLSQLLRLVES